MRCGRHLRGADNSRWLPIRQHQTLTELPGKVQRRYMELFAQDMGLEGLDGAGWRWMALDEGEIRANWSQLEQPKPVEANPTSSHIVPHDVPRISLNLFHPPASSLPPPSIACATRAQLTSCLVFTSTGGRATNLHLIFSFLFFTHTQHSTRNTIVQLASLAKPQLCPVRILVVF